jgi:demethylsterigmatocystin 6-O-methyltransferase
MQASSPASIILIDEIVLANGSAHWQAVQLDITMMASLGAMERSHAQWVSLLDAAGLIVENIFSYTEEAAESLIVAVMKVAV